MKHAPLDLLHMQYNGLKMGNNADQSCLFIAEEKKAEMKLKELLQTPNEIVEVLKGLIFAKDDKQSLFDGSTKEMVSSPKQANLFRISFFSLLHPIKSKFIYG